MNAAWDKRYTAKIGLQGTTLHSPQLPAFLATNYEPCLNDMFYFYSSQPLLKVKLVEENQDILPVNPKQASPPHFH